jgi:hypothetical protein
MGGRKKFIGNLDALFANTNINAKGLDDVQGRIGEYWHGNDPSQRFNPTGGGAVEMS